MEKHFVVKEHQANYTILKSEYFDRLRITEL